MSEREQEIKVILSLVKDILSEADLTIAYNSTRGCLVVYDHQTDKEYVILEDNEKWEEN